MMFKFFQPGQGSSSLQKPCVAEETPHSYGIHTYSEAEIGNSALSWHGELGSGPKRGMTQMLLHLSTYVGHCLSRDAEVLKVGWTKDAFVVNL